MHDLLAMDMSGVNEMTTTRTLNGIILHAGAHDSFGNGHCVMEVAAWFAGEKHSASPACVSLVVRHMAITLNDRWDHVDRQRLLPLVPLMIGTAGDRHDETRGFMVLDWLVRTCTPTWLDLAGLTSEAAALRRLRPIVDCETERAARPLVESAAAASAAAASATTAASASASAASAYAYDAYAAAYAAYAAAYATTASAYATTASASAASAAWRATGEAMNDSVLELLRAMCLVGREGVHLLKPRTHRELVGAR